MSDKAAILGCRTVRLGDRLYIRVEDVAHIIRSLGETEETDVRNRCNELARNVEALLGVKGL